MKHILFPLLIIFSIVMGACGTGSIQTEQPVGTDLPRATSTLLPSATSTSTATPTASPTPVFVFDLSEYDPDILQPVVVEHDPPMIARLDETVMLAFYIINTIYCEHSQQYCQLEPSLYYSYGDTETFQRVILLHEVIAEMEVLVARLPAADEAGRSLRYYAEFSVPEAGYTLRYPVTGTIDLFATSNFISIKLPASDTVEPGDKVYTFFWGAGANTVRTSVEYHIRIGPPALDVADDGRIALLNPVNNGVLLYDPEDESFANFTLPFPYKSMGDLVFDQNGELVVCDFQGESRAGARGRLPYCYRLLADGELIASAPVYANFPMKLTEDLKVLDGYDNKLIDPFRSREAQRQKQTWGLPYRFVMRTDGMFDWSTARFADLEAGLAFEVHSDFNLGALDGFEKTPQGYLMTFSEGFQIRAIWIDPTGRVLKDVTLPNSQYSMLSVYAQTAVARDGSLYVMSSTKNGIEIHFEEAPQQ